MSLCTKSVRTTTLRDRAYPLFFAIVLCASLVIPFPTAAYAHPPKAVTLAYDAQKQELSVTITHSTFFPSKHYVKTVDITQNGKQVKSSTYTSQPTSDTFTYTYPLQAKPGDEFAATAGCNIFGTTEGKLAIPK